jgi:hypothetical protein
MERTWWTRVKDLVLEARIFWYQKVVNYHSYNQRRLGEDVKQFFMGLLKTVGDYFRRLGEGFWALLYHGVLEQAVKQFAVFLFFATGGVVVLAIAKRLLRPSRSARSCNYRLELLDQLLRRMRRKGLVASPGCTTRELLLRAGREFHLPHEPMKDLCDLEYRWRWGGRPPSEAETERALRHYRTLTELLKRNDRCESPANVVDSSD